MKRSKAKRILTLLWSTLAAAAIIVSQSRAAQNMDFLAKPPLTFSAVFVSQGPNGPCLLNADSGSVFYEEPGSMLVRYSSSGLFDRDPVFFSCRQDSVYVVEPDQITWINLQAVEKVTFYMGTMVNDSNSGYEAEDTFATSVTWASDEGLTYVDAVDFNDDIFLLARDSNSSLCSIERISTKKLTTSTYETEFPCAKTSVLEKHEDLCMAISEAKKGQTYLLVFKIKEDLSGYSFEALEDVAGKIKIEHKPDSLLVQAGMAAIEISAAQSTTKALESDEMGCFKDPDSGDSYVCITQKLAKQ